MEMPHVSNTGIDLILDKLESAIARAEAAETERDMLRGALAEMREYINRNDQLMASERWLLSTIEAALPTDNTSHVAP